MPEAVIDIVPRVAEYQRRIAQLPGWTDKAAADAAKKLERRFKEAQAKAVLDTMTTSNNAVKAASEAAEAAADNINAWKRASSGVAPQLSGWLDSIEEFHEGSARIGVDAMKQRVALLALGSGVTAAVTAVTAAAALVVGSSIDVIAHLDDYHGRLGEHRDDLFAARVAYEGVQNAATRLRVELAGQTAPAITKSSDALTGVITLGQQATSVLGDFGGTTTDVTGSLIELVPVIGNAYMAFDALATYGRTAREEIDGVRTAEEMLQAQIDRRVEEEDELMKSMAETAHKLAVQRKEEADEEERRQKEAQRAAEQRAREAAARAAAQAREEGSAWKRLSDIVADYRAKGLDAWGQIADRRDRAIAQLQEFAVSERTSSAATEAAALIRQQALRDEIDLRDELATKFMEQVRRQKEADQEALERTAAGAQEGISAAFARLDAEEEADATRRKLIEQSRDTQKNAFNQTLEYATQTVAGMLDLFDTQTKGGRKAALALFAVQKAVSVAQIAVNTAQAITAALTIPPPAGPILAVATGAAAAVQAGAALAAQPRFHTGLFNDERPAVVRRGEVVVPAPMVAANGGAEQVRKKLRDEPSNRPIIVRAVFSDREVAVPLAREVGWYMPRDALMGWRDG